MMGTDNGKWCGEQCGENVETGSAFDEDSSNISYTTNGAWPKEFDAYS